MPPRRRRFEGEVLVLDATASSSSSSSWSANAKSSNRCRSRSWGAGPQAERCLFALTDEGLELREVAPGVDLDRDILAQMGFRPTVSPQLTEMDPAIFRPEALQLRHRAPTPLDQRLSYDETQNTLSCNFEGLALTTAEDAKSLAAHLEETFRSIGRRVKVVVNYDNFEINAEAIPTFFEMIARNEEHVLSRTRYSTNAYYRRRLGHQFTAASLQHRLYGNYADALTGVQLE